MAADDGRPRHADLQRQGGPLSETSPLEQLDFLYMPSRDPAAEARYLTEVLGARPVFAIEAFGTRVAMLELGEAPPQLLLADHLEGERPVLLYRVADIDAATAQLERRGWDPEPQFGIPQGPCCAFRAEGGHRIAIYELTRPEVEERFAGRFDF